MRNARAWLWGLIPLVVVWVLANLTTGVAVKIDLTNRANERMAQQGQPWARADISGRDARIVSAAPSPGAKVSAIDAAADTRGVRRVSGEGEVLPPRNPYTWSAQRTASGIVLQGYAPDDAARQQMRKAAASGGTVESKVELADGAPKEFAAAVAYALAQLGRLAEGDAALSNNTLTISGRAATREGYAAFVEAMKNVPQGFSLSSANIIPPRVSPFTFTATRNGSGLTLEGFVPDDSIRSQIVANATRLLGGAQVTSKLELADGAPNGFFAIANYALEQLARMSEGSAALSDLALTLRGRAKDAGSHAALAEAMRNPPSGAQVAPGQIAPPIVSPYVWSVEKDAQGLVLRGAVPDMARREANVAAVRGAAAGANVRDEQFIADGAPANFAAHAAAAIAAVPKLDEGKGEIRDAGLAVSGKAPTQDLLAEIRKAMESAGLNVAITEGVTAPEPVPVQMPAPPEAPPLSSDLVTPAPPAAPAPQVAAPPPPPAPTPAPVVVRAPEPASAPAQSCKDKVTAAVDGRVVLFKRSSAVIDDASEPLLRAIAGALKDCGSLSVAIEGHADNEGAQLNNQRLSEARAAAVVGALKEAGASDARLTSAGFGFTKPLVPNTSADNKAKNRRVEFIIR